MMRLDGCLRCYSGSYKFMRGCEACALQSIMQFKGGEDDLINIYTQARADVATYITGKIAPSEE